MPSKKYQLTDLATGRSSELAALSGTVGPDVLDISTLPKDQGVFTYDPGFMSTAATSSAITYIDGDAGVLLYRGYPIEQLAEHSNFLEVSQNGASAGGGSMRGLRSSSSSRGTGVLRSGVTPKNPASSAPSPSRLPRGSVQPPTTSSCSARHLSLSQSRERPAT